MEHFCVLFQELLANFSCAFSTPTRYSLLAITLGWILCSGKRTMTGILRAAGTHATKSHVWATMERDPKVTVMVPSELG